MSGLTVIFVGLIYSTV